MKKTFFSQSFPICYFVWVLFSIISYNSDCHIFGLSWQIVLVFVFNLCILGAMRSSIQHTIRSCCGVRWFCIQEQFLFELYLQNREAWKVSRNCSSSSKSPPSWRASLSIPSHPIRKLPCGKVRGAFTWITKIRKICPIDKFF